MNLSLSRDEESLVRYACQEMAQRRLQQAIDCKSPVDPCDWAGANRQEARQYFAIAQRISDYQNNSNFPPKCPHGNEWFACDACDRESDFQADCYRERQHFGR